jgi:extracellular elastinolytic metalloproteinase
MCAKKNLLYCLILIFVQPFAFGQEQTALDIALRHLEQKREKLQLTSEDIRHFDITDAYSSRHNGLSHIYLNQKHKGVKVYNALININVLPDGRVLNMGNRFISNLAEKANNSIPTISPTIALQKVSAHFGIATVDAEVRLQEKVNDQHYIFAPEGIALEPIVVKLVYQAMPDKSVRLSWMVQWYQLDAQHWWNARVDAHNGKILAHHDQVIHCDFGKGKCLAENHSHHPPSSSGTGINTTGSSGNDKTVSNTNNSLLLNSYNVFPMPVQSPSHGNRALVSSPADPTASPFGWHDTDGVMGAEYSITRGNNVHAYQDIFSLNTSLGDEPDGGVSLDFDFPLDLSGNTPYTQIDPAVTNLFYWNNILHDLWYLYGFDEMAGNFQVNNYSNGGIAGDYVRAEALDGSGTNNANFGTAEDGTEGRMQMYIWTEDPLPPGGTSDLIVTEPMSVAGSYVQVAAAFGALLPNPGITSTVVLVDDGVGVTSDGCEAIVNGADISGHIAMIDRGTCQFGTKALAAENEGAIAVIICNNVAGGAIAMAPGDDGAAVTIPVVMISQEDCAVLRLTIPDLTVSLQGISATIPLPGPSGLDGDLDNGIIAHEYGHGITIRMTGGPSTGGCLSNEEQAGEGWSDWFALVMTTDASNTADEPRGIGTYALGQPTDATGIREYPYSRDMTVDPHTYGDVPNVAVPHGVGSVWCAMIWDLYWNLIDEYGFDADSYNGSGGNNIAMQLVMDGVKLQACNPTFIDSRDAIIAADGANNNGENFCLIWETFARRGLGFSASAGGNEAFDTPSICTPLVVTKTAAAEVQAGGVLTYTLEITNNLPSLVGNVNVTDAFPEGTSYVAGSLTCPNGSVNGNILTINIQNLAQGSTLTCSYDLQIASTPFSYIDLEDGVENGTDNWGIESPIGTAIWATNNNSYAGDFAWFASDISTSCDQYLTLVAPLNLGGAHPVLSFWHRYNTEASWDGGVVEISTNGGTNWNDLGNNMIQNGYDSNLQDNPASPISGRPAFHGNSGAYIQTVIDLTNYADTDFLIRFRFGCDGAVGGEGWYIDDIQFFGDYHAITNTACGSSSPDDENCDEVTTVITGQIVATKEPANALRLHISPNPTDGVFSLRMNSTYNSGVAIQIWSVDGRLLQAAEYDSARGQYTFDLSEYAPGLYVMTVQTERERVVRKVVVE